MSWSFLVSSAVFAFANNFRALEEVLLGNLLDLGTRCGINDRPQNKGCLNMSGSICPSVLWMSRQWNPPGQAHSLVQRLLPLMRLGVGDALRRPSPASAGKGWSWGLDRQPLDPSRSRPAAGARCSSVIRCPNATQ